MILTHVSSSFEDVSQQSVAVEGWPLQYVQMSSGRFSGSSKEVRFGGLQLFRETSNATVNQFGASRGNCVVFGYALRVAGPIVVNGTAILPSHIGVLRGDRELDAMQPPMDLMVLAVDSALLEDHFFATACIDLDKWARHGVLSVEARGRAAHFGAELLEVLEVLSGERDGWDAAALEGAREDLLALLVPIVLAQQNETRPTLSVFGRAQIVRRAREFVLDRISEPLRVSDICRHLRVSPRALQYSFQDTLGTNPVSYLKLLRLNGARRDLIAAGNSALQVKDVVARWGVWHLSRFSAEYRHLFGELPSATLQAARSRC
ncbi:helix-turn-helix domain-containing protein [Hydrogenophaga sp. BPS33]|uniref:helix-turn-helix domain-containing protein n=1 Tax=Hydrogenophaga sp. BPS33 TaxID=2651974 RepID=UPI0013205357|nr:helix-turn-helix domain-containing protein [Hydrogenophaga sp. BPS33]QHE84625.1 helix-turn-helix domain-containing protein [Hydrogenophaga sp. BPS33]